MAAITRHSHQITTVTAIRLADVTARRCECCDAVPAAHTPMTPCWSCGHYAAYQTERFAPIGG